MKKFLILYCMILCLPLIFSCSETDPCKCGNDQEFNNNNNNGNQNYNNIVGIWFSRYVHNKDNIIFNYYTQYGADKTGFEIEYNTEKEDTNKVIRHSYKVFTYNIYDDIICYDDYETEYIKFITINNEIVLSLGSIMYKVDAIPEKVKTILDN